MKKYKVTFSFRTKRMHCEVDAENEAMAKQRLLAMVEFYAVNHVDRGLYNVLFFINDYRISTTVTANFTEGAKTAILNEIKFDSIELSEEDNDVLNFLKGFRK